MITIVRANRQRHALGRSLDGVEREMTRLEIKNQTCSQEERRWKGEIQLLQRPEAVRAKIMVRQGRDGLLAPQR